MRIMRMALIGAAALAAPGHAQEATRPQPLTNPGSWIQPSDYPAGAIRARAEGRVVAELGIDAAGKVTSCRVSQSSGNAQLDAATCAVVTGRGAFKPATDAQGRALASRYTLPVRWSLPDDTIEVTAPGVTLDTDMAVELSLDGQGKVLACRVLTAKMAGPANVQANSCEPFAVGRQGGFPLRWAGQPIPYKVVHRLSRQVVLTP